VRSISGRRNPRQVREQLGVAVRGAGKLITCSPGRNPANGPHEIKEFGPATKSSLEFVLRRAGIGDREVELNRRIPVKNFTRATTEADLVVQGPEGLELVAELKCWDIDHQLFDLAKVSCLLNSGAAAGFLVCAAKNSSDFDRQPGGELFPVTEGETRQHDFQDLFDAHPVEWSKHVGKGSPEATEVPTKVSTTAIVTGVELDAYSGHEVRAVEVEITDPAPIELVDGKPV
jgi:hypothetical protein